VNEFVEDAKAGGLVARLIEQEGLQGVKVTPTQKR
jgi:hypothetical protein